IVDFSGWRAVRVVLSYARVGACGGCVFFFQAEDGIRDWSVTGVQTCALPISGTEPGASRSQAQRAATDTAIAWMARGHIQIRTRSEERRVGKEWRSRWAACE